MLDKKDYLKYNMDLISVIVPVYNVEQYLDECVQSIVDQIYSNLEIILVDDGSPDNCPQICDDWALRDDRIKVIHKKNGGLSSARNAGIEIATGQYIGFVDSDDIINPEMYLSLISQFSIYSDLAIAATSLMAYTPTKQWRFMKFQNVEYNKPFSMEIAIKHMISGSIDASVCDKLFKRIWFNNVRFCEGKLNEDWLFWYYSIKQNYATTQKMIVTDTSHYMYRVTPNSICNQDPSKSSKRLFFDIIANSDIIIDDMERWNPLLKEYILPFRLSILLKACVEINKYPILKRERKDECEKIIKQLHSAKIFKKYYNHSLFFNIGIIIGFYLPMLYPWYASLLNRLSLL